MSSWIRLLLVALLLQIGLVLFFQIQDKELAVYEGGDQLLPIEFDSVSRIEITQPEKETLIIAKKDSKWVLPEKKDFPVSETRIEELKNEIFEIKRPWPAGSTSAAAKKFEVEKDNFRTKLSFHNDQSDIATLYFGSSPGFRKVHARLSGEDVIYSLDLHAHQINAEEGPWLDRQLLRVAREDIKGLELNNFTLELEGETITLTELPEDYDLSQQRAESVLRMSSGVNFTEFLGGEDHEKYFSKEDATFSYSIKTREDADITISYKEDGEEEILLRSSLYPFLFKASKSQFENIQKLTKEDLIEKEESLAEDQSDQDSTQEDDS